MAYLHTGQAAYPIRIGHEWCGVVTRRRRGRRPGLARPPGHRRHHARLRPLPPLPGGRQHLCADRYEIGIRNGWPGALAEQLPVPATALHPSAGHRRPRRSARSSSRAATRCARSAPRRWHRGIGCSCSGPARSACSPRQFAARAGRRGAPAGPRRALARLRPGARLRAHLDRARRCPRCASTRSSTPPTRARCRRSPLELVEPGGRVVYIGLAGEPSLVDTRTLALKDVTAVGVLSASGGLAGTIDLYASGAVDPRPLVAATVGLEEAAGVLAGDRRRRMGPRPEGPRRSLNRVTRHSIPLIRDRASGPEPGVRPG